MYKLHSGKWYLRVDSRVECSDVGNGNFGSPAFRQILFADMPLLMLYLGIPVYYMYLLRRSKHRLSPPMEDQFAALQRR